MSVTSTFIQIGQAADLTKDAPLLRTWAPANSNTSSSGGVDVQGNYCRCLTYQHFDLT